jgi:hypothetical protein
VGAVAATTDLTRVLAPQNERQEKEFAKAAWLDHGHWTHFEPVVGQLLQPVTAKFLQLLEVCAHLALKQEPERAAIELNCVTAQAQLQQLAARRSTLMRTLMFQSRLISQKWLTTFLGWHFAIRLAELSNLPQAPTFASEESENSLAENKS